MEYADTAAGPYGLPGPDVVDAARALDRALRAGPPEAALDFLSGLPDGLARATVGESLLGQRMFQLDFVLGVGEGRWDGLASLLASGAGGFPFLKFQAEAAPGLGRLRGAIEYRFGAAFRDALGLFPPRFGLGPAQGWLDRSLDAEVGRAVAAREETVPAQTLLADVGALAFSRWAPLVMSPDVFASLRGDHRYRTLAEAAMRVPWFAGSGLSPDRFLLSLLDSPRVEDCWKRRAAETLAARFESGLAQTGYFRRLLASISSAGVKYGVKYCSAPPYAPARLTLECAGLGHAFRSPALAGLSAATGWMLREWIAADGAGFAAALGCAEAFAGEEAA